MKPFVRASLLAAAITMAGAAASAAPAKAPRNTLDPGGIEGVWIAGDFSVRRMGKPVPADEVDGQVPKDADGAPLPMQPWARGIYEQRMKDAKDGHPFANTKSRCLPAGLPGSMKPPHTLPLQILVNRGQITVLLEEFNIFRIIHMDGRPHPADPDPSFFGHSVGRWEGRTLVVDTVGLNTDTTFGVVPHSEALHVVERYTQAGDKLEISITVEDPKAFTRPWVQRSAFIRSPEGIREYFCQNDRNTPDATGRTGAQLISTQ